MQEKFTNMGLVQPLVVTILFVVHLLDFTIQNQPIPNADVHIPWPIHGHPILKDSIISLPQNPILAHLLEPFHVLPHKQAIADQNNPLPVKRVWLIFCISCVNAANNCIPRCLWHWWKKISQKGTAETQNKIPQLTAWISWVVTTSSAPSLGQRR